MRCGWDEEDSSDWTSQVSHFSPNTNFNLLEFRGETEECGALQTQVFDE